MLEYLVSLLIVILLGFLGLVLLNIFSLRCADKAVEIIIDGNEACEDLEKLILSAKIVTEKHFTGARIYIIGGDEAKVNALCRRYGVLKK